MKRSEFICVLGRIASGCWPRRRTIIVIIAAIVLPPIEVSHAGWLSDLFKGSSKQGKSSRQGKPPKHVTSPKPAALAKRAASPKPQATKLAALGPVQLSPAALKPAAARCDPAKLRIVLDVGHTAESEGAISARNVSEFVFNLRLAKRIEEKLKAEGFSETKLLLTEGKARRSLFKRVAAANDLRADLLLSIHHDSVPNKFLEEWEFEGKKSRFSDRFSGYSVFVSRSNPDFKTSFAFAELIAKEMKAQGLDYARQYSQPIMGRYQRELLNKETGVYRYDELIVLRKTQMAAVLLEAGSIINRDEELQMSSPERRDIISSGVTAAVKQFCEPRWAMLGPL
ncbi:N-acetylmuramoyl-L-alanine amidase [Bradyrhizobium sp. WSM 1738]|uniref:N-acetylmuramoyl-L-alanine amidase family protein n=1 Tax=Bradyrhizobium hereditatis TaxID=2821405 RepID=UPI00289D72B2|nr:N-acetylmuramoyl-L-alanine amidase [Bradyrhizobium hereditatis]MCA6115903.1 N-acetylmuramoyl-L-alanine amidase [Bradyrhizobium hereditatis]